MARTKVCVKRRVRDFGSPKDDADAGTGAEEIDTETLIRGPSFAVALKDNHFCFEGGSKFLRIPRRFVEAHRQYGGRFGPHDWVELSAVGDSPIFKCRAVLVRNERRGTLQIGKGFEKLASQYALRPGNCLRFTLDAASQFSVEMCNNRTAYEIEEDQIDESTEEEGEEETAWGKDIQPQPRSITDEKLARGEPVDHMLQQRDHKSPVGNKKSKTALEIAKRKRHGRKRCKTMSEIGEGSGDEGSDPSAVK